MLQLLTHLLVTIYYGVKTDVFTNALKTLAQLVSAPNALMVLTLVLGIETVLGNLLDREVLSKN